MGWSLTTRLEVMLVGTKYRMSGFPGALFNAPHSHNFTAGGDSPFSNGLYDSGYPSELEAIAQSMNNITKDFFIGV
jgi:hypothetical protein